MPTRAVTMPAGLTMLDLQPRDPWRLAYSDEASRLYQGEALTMLRAMPSESIDLLATDPPYSSGGLFRGDRSMSTRAKYVTADSQSDCADFAGDNRDQRAYLAWLTLWLTETLRVMKSGRIIVLFADWRQLPTTTDAMQCAGFIWRGIGTWKKASGRPGLGIATGGSEFMAWGCKGSLDPGHDVYLPSVLDGATPRDAERVHQTQKPLGLMERLVTLAPPGGIVFDPFAGSGTTLVAARTQGRRGIGVELTDEYAQVAADRLAQSTIGDAPELGRLVPMPEPIC